MRSSTWVWLVMIASGCAPSSASDVGSDVGDGGRDGASDVASDGAGDAGCARELPPPLGAPTIDGECPEGACPEGTRCWIGTSECICPLGLAGARCEACAEGYERRDGACVLLRDGDFDHWPNEVSAAASDPWIMAHHDDIRVMRPRVLALDFVNAHGPEAVRPLLESIVAGFTEGSRPLGDVDAEAAPQLEIELVGIRDLRDGAMGRPAPPDGYEYENSTLFPRRAEGEPGYWGFDYATLFTPEMAEHLGFADGAGGFLDLCQAAEQGLVHELWIVGSADVPDVNAAEVLGATPFYSPTGNRMEGFDRCAGNGCFDADVPFCGRTLRIGFVNYNRGPGCYLHSHGHGMETTARRAIVPGWYRWWLPFARFDLSARHGLPFDDLYAVGCEAPPCLSYPDASTLVIQHGASSFTVDDWDPVCGDVHFPPNAEAHYDYDDARAVDSSCRSFGRSLCPGQPRTAPVSRADWARYEALSPDCGGAFLIWWFQSMPAHGTGQTFEDGAPMRSVWPYTFY